MRTFAELKKNLKKELSGFGVVKVAVMADSSSQLFVQALKGYGVECGLNISVFEADYDQIDMQVNDPGSELYAEECDYIIIFHSVQKLQKKFFKYSLNERKQFADDQKEYLSDLFQTIQSNSKSKIIYFNFPYYDDAVFGHFSNQLEFSWIYQLRKLNMILMDLSASFKNLSLSDIALLSQKSGDQIVFDPRMYVHGDIALSLEFLPHVAKSVCDIINTQKGKLKKCLILDLDNTTWGGIIGDDGIENIQIGDLGIGKAFTELQLWAKQLKERGIILAVCSKNTESVAKEPFEKHPEMILRLDDIAVFVANWENKVDNIRHIQEVLNIGFDSMVFVDDNPFERGIVKTHLPEITVPELPEDPAEYMPYLRSLNLFETASFSNEDLQRTQQYQEESKRAVVRRSFLNEAEYLQNLEMEAEVKAFDKFSIPRVAQLSQRSNQFNLRTIRYTEDDILRIANEPDYFTISFSLKDKFGDYGLIAVIILKKLENKRLFIETWLMSCRVLKRGMENFTLNTIVEIAKSNGFEWVTGEYISTPKNAMVADHYSKLGFSEANGQWVLSTKDFKNKETYIKSN